MAKKWVPLLNLGSPDSTKTSAVRAYLDEFLMDKRVIDYPLWLRMLVVRGIILRTRPPKTAEAYRSIWTSSGSPLIETSFRQLDKVSEQVEVPVALGMRYGNPSTASAVASLVHQGVDSILIFPLYPHYAMSSFETAYVKAIEVLNTYEPKIKKTLVQPFYQDPEYIAALAASARPYLSQNGFDKLLISFHGLPERHLRKSDPSGAHCLSCLDCCQNAHPAHATCYRHQCFTTAKKVTQALGLTEDDYLVSFQSRLGRDPWLRPYTDVVVEELAQAGVKKLLVMCPAFVTDCLETLEEIGMGLKESFEGHGKGNMILIPCLNTHPFWISFMCKKINTWLKGIES